MATARAGALAVTAREGVAAILEWARKVQAIAQNGLTFSRDPFDRARYRELEQLTATMLATELEVPLATVRTFWEGEHGYATPKVDVRGGVFRGA